MSSRLVAQWLKGLAATVVVAMAIAAPVAVWMREMRVTLPSVLPSGAALRTAGTSKKTGSSLLNRDGAALGDTYLGLVIADRDSLLERWPTRVGKPLRVWMADASGLKGWRPAYEDAVREAFREWSTAGVPVRFAFVSDSSTAEITVRFHRSLARKAAGITEWRSDRDRWLRGANITLALRASNGRPMDRRGVKAVALHEIGHALGLGHSPGRRDIMAPWVTAERLSRRDRATVRLLYSLPVGRITN